MSLQGCLKVPLFRLLNERIMFFTLVKSTLSCSVSVRFPQPASSSDCTGNTHMETKKKTHHNDGNLKAVFMADWCSQEMKQSLGGDSALTGS